MSKAAVIREYIQKNPAMGPSELAALVTKNSKLVVTPTDVSVTKFNMNNSNKSKVARKSRKVTVRASATASVELANFNSVLTKAQQVVKLANTMSVSDTDLNMLLTTAERIGLKNSQTLLNVFSK